VDEAVVFDDADGEGDIGSQGAVVGDGLDGEGVAERFAGDGAADLASVGGEDEVAGDEVGLDVDDGGLVEEVEAVNVDGEPVDAFDAGGGEADGVGARGGADGEDAVETGFARVADAARGDLEDVAFVAPLVEPGEDPEVGVLLDGEQGGGELLVDLEDGGDAPREHGLAVGD
jgi:hypothetical protein